MYEQFIDHFDGMKFESLEEYNREVLRFVTDVTEELGKAERWALMNDPEVFEQLGVEIKDVYPEKEC